MSATLRGPTAPRDTMLPCVSQWGELERNDAVVMRRTDTSTLEVFLPGTNLPRSLDWIDQGYRSPEEYLFWSRKVCGLACLQSLLLGWTQVRLSIRDLLAIALDRGCYLVEPSGQVQGMLYRPFIAWISDQFGFDCQLVERTSIHESARQIAADWVMIASVSAEIRDPAIIDPHRGGHLVLVHSVSDDGLVRFHNPSGYSYNSNSASLPIESFERFHADRGILIRRRVS